jgi:hypothetical protein
MVWLRRAHLVVAWAFVAGVVIQVFLAGLGVFESSARFGTHVGWGYLLGMSTFVLIALSAIGGLGRRQVLYALGLLGMFAVQSFLVYARDSSPVVAALHPVNGFAILFVSIAMAREAWRMRDREAVAATAPRPAEGAAGG